MLVVTSANPTSAAPLVPSAARGYVGQRVTACTWKSFALPNFFWLQASHKAWSKL